MISTTPRSLFGSPWGAFRRPDPEHPGHGDAHDHVGAVGVEFATLYSQLGVKVTLLEGLDRLVPLEDEEISKEMLSAFKKAGIDCRVGARVGDVLGVGDPGIARPDFGGRRCRSRCRGIGSCRG